MFNQSGRLLLLFYLYFLSFKGYANSYKTIIFSLLWILRSFTGVLRQYDFDKTLKHFSMIFFCVAVLNLSSDEVFARDTTYHFVSLFCFNFSIERHHIDIKLNWKFAVEVSFFFIFCKSYVQASPFVFWWQGAERKNKDESKTVSKRMFKYMKQGSGIVFVCCSAKDTLGSVGLVTSFIAN